MPLDLFVVNCVELIVVVVDLGGFVFAFVIIPVLVLLVQIVVDLAMFVVVVLPVAL